jgi:hypothetical protein
MKVDLNSKTTYLVDTKRRGVTVDTFGGGWEFTKLWRTVSGRKKFWRGQNLSKSIAQKRFYLYNNVRDKFKTQK